MAIKPFNSVAGFSVGEYPYTTIVQANGDINTTNITTTGVSNLNSVGNVKISGGSAGQVLSTDGAGNLSFITIGTASLNNGTSNVTVLNSGNILFSVAGNANVGVVTGTGINVAGYLNVTGNANVGNLGTAQVLASANVTAPQLISNVSTGTAPLVVSSTTLVSNLNADLLDGYNTAVANTASTVVVRDANGNVSANYFVGDGSQLTGLPSGTSIANGSSNVSAGTANGNITVSVSGNANVVVFTGAGVNVAGYANVTGNIEAGGVKTDNLYYANGTPWDLQQPAGSNTYIQYNDNGSFGASANFAFDDTTQLLTVAGSSAQVNIGANTYISNSQIWLGNTDWVNGASYTQLTDTYVSVQDGGVGPSSRYGAIATSGITYSDDTYTFDISSTTGIYQNQTSLSTQFNVYPNAAIRSIYGGGAGLQMNNTQIAWDAADGNNFTANAAGAYHTQKFQAPQLVSNVATGTAPFVVTSTTQVANLNVANAGYATSAGTAGSATTAGTVTTNAQPNITSVGTLTSLSVTGNVSAANFVGALANGNSNVAIPSTNGNVNITAVGNTTLVVTGTGANITGTVNASGNANVGNLGTAQVLATANITAPQLISNVATGTAPFVVSSITRVANLNVATAGNADSATNASAVLNNVITSGTVYPTFISSTANGNYSLTSNTAYTANIANGFLGATLLGGTLTTASQPNVTSVGTLSSLDVTGNITSSANVVTDFVVGKTGSITIAATGSDQDIELKPTGNGTVDVWGKIISNLATPNASTDAATKQYVDDVAQGLHTHDSCAAATPDTLANITSGTVTYNNGLSGVGANLTTTGSFNLIDGVNVQTSGTRILVKNEANSAWNGIYTWSNATVITRATDFDTPTEMAGGDFTFVNGGTLYDNTGWVMTDAVTTVGTSPVPWVQFSGAGTYTAGTGLTLNGSQFNIANTTVTAASYGNGDAVATFTVNAQGQLTAASNVAITANAANLTGTTLASTIVNSSLTSVGTLGSLSVTGNGTFGNVYANSGTIGASLLAGTLTTNAQPNITSVGTLTSVSVTGNVTAGNVYANSGIIGAQTLKGEGGNISNIQGANVSGTVSSATTAGTVTTNAQPNITSVGTLTSLSVTGNVSAGNISGTNGNLTTANVSSNVILGNASVTTQITWASATTSSTSANQTIATFSATGVTGVEYIVKSIDATGSKYGVATVIAVTDGTNVDYSTYGTVQLGGFTGTLAVNIVGGQVRLQVTPASSNSTVWTTQYRLI